MAESVFIVGAARSGKTRHALALARRHPAPRAYLATGAAGDAEMAARIALHRAERGADFTTLEEPRALAATLAGLPAATGVAVVDCLTLWIANLTALADDAVIEREVAALAETVAARPFPIIVVSNEVGAGIVPFDPAVRRYRDLLGSANQRLAAAADTVLLMVAGVALRVKPSGG